MRTILLALVAMAAVSAHVSHADVVTEWNEAALDSIRAGNTSPPAAARNLAILHAAIYDAVNGIRRTHEPYLATGRVPFGASVEAAASSAAHTVLVALYPSDEAAFDQIHAAILNRIPKGPHKHRGSAWGTNAAVQILIARANDGSAATEPWPGSEQPRSRRAKATRWRRTRACLRF